MATQLSLTRSFIISRTITHSWVIIQNGRKEEKGALPFFKVESGLFVLVLFGFGQLLCSLAVDAGFHIR